MCFSKYVTFRDSLLSKASLKNDPPFFPGLVMALVELVPVEQIHDYPSLMSAYHSLVAANQISLHR